MCIREHKAGQRKPAYVALSYVWGSAPQLTLTLANKAALLQTGGLLASDVHLPIAVQDALKGVTSLGFDHVWVDALCIIQDEEIDKAQQIISMRDIYRQAAVTIRLFRTANFNLVDRLPGIRKAMCQSGVLWYEDTIPPPNASAAMTGIADYREPNAPVRDPEGKNKDYTHLLGSQASAAVRYSELLSDYQDRKLSFPDDHLNAITGILETIGGSVWGLSREFFVDALCWTADRPYAISTLDSSAPMRPLAQFPSWSWAAWKSPGTVLYTVTGSDRVTAPVPVFTICRGKDSRPYHTTVVCTKRPISCTFTTVCPSHREDAQALDQDLSKSSDLMELSTRSRPRSILRFRSYTVNLYVPASPKAVPATGSSAQYDVYADSAMTMLLTDFFLEPSWRPSQGETLSFLYVGVRGYKTLIFLLIELRDGIAYRRPSVIYVKKGDVVWQPAIVTLA
ncbi:hypothetical protein LTR95_012058 [Oleoguttula sp. CCFEE 5521]